MIRSFLLAPGNRPDLVVKFPRFGADCCVIDLEDGTPQAAKASARALLPDTVAKVRAAGYGGLLTVRVNVPASEHYLADLEVAFACDIDGVVVPKLEHAGQLFPVSHWIRVRDAEQPRAQSRFIIGGFESVRGVLASADLCARARDLRAVYFGAEDFSADIGGRRTRGGHEVHTARSMVVMAAKAAGLGAIDQVVVDIRDDALYGEDAAAGRDLGYDGKACVTPGQVKLAHRAFSATTAERDYAARLVAAYDAACAQGRGTIDFEGKMVDGPLLKRAQAVLAMPAAQ
jgi:citrate lyase subunit beta/citryl-CoA lyase